MSSSRGCADARCSGRRRCGLEARARGFEVVGIDEVQFFEPSVVATALGLAEAGVRVVAAGLDQDFRRLPFGPMPELLSHAEFVDKLGPSVTAAAGRRQRRSVWSTAARRAVLGETVVVGAAEQYEARCRDCHEPGADASLGASAAA